MQRRTMLPMAHAGAQRTKPMNELLVSSGNLHAVMDRVADLFSAIKVSIQAKKASSPFRICASSY
jgi:hypothetical protein